MIHVSGIQLPDLIKGPSRIQQRLLDSAGDDTPHPVLFQHTVLCQTCLPFRNPGDDVRTWERLNGNIHLEVNAGKAMHPELQRLVPIGLPFGPKARMILMHINQQALRHQSPEIEIQDTLTKFVGRMLGLAPHGRNMRIVKDQLARLSAASIRLGVVKDGHALTVNTQIVSAFDIWFPKDDSARSGAGNLLQMAFGRGCLPQSDTIAADLPALLAVDELELLQRALDNYAAYEPLAIARRTAGQTPDGSLGASEERAGQGHQ